MIQSRTPLFASLILVICLTFGMTNSGLAQDQTTETTSSRDTADWDPDKIYEAARELAYDEEFTSSRKWLRFILEKNPEYVDVRIFLGRTYAWEEKYKQAESHYTAVLETNPKNITARLAYIDILRWQELHQQVIQQADVGLAYQTDHPDLLFYKAQALAETKSFARAQTIIQRLELRHPTYAGTTKLRKAIKEQAMLNETGIRLGTDLFSRTYDPMYNGSLTYGRETEMFSKLTGRLNFARRFEENGIQFEIDSYPTLSDRMYAYLAYAYSPSAIFTDHRAGAELYRAFGSSTELSLGLRFMHFANGNSSMIYTGSVGYYWNKYWFSIRPFIIPESDGISRSVNLTTRRFLNEGTDYIGLSVTLGASPDEEFVQLESGELDKDVLYLNSQKAGLEYQKQLSIAYQFTIRFDVEHQELRFSPGDYVWIYSLAAGLNYRF